MRRPFGQTKVEKPTKYSSSLRTVIPAHIVAEMSLQSGDFVEWKMDKEGDKWLAIITKSEENKDINISNNENNHEPKEGYAFY